MNIDDAYKALKAQGFKNQRDCFKKGVAFGIEVGKQMAGKQNE